MENLLRSITRVPSDVDFEDLIARTKEGDSISIVFKAARKAPEETPLRISGLTMRKGREYVVRVKRWMTRSTTDESFDFMKQWNNNIPMPLQVMRGRVLSETRGMLYMELRACPLKTDYCMRCGKPLSHPVSRLYGLGPECGSHYHINPFETEEELQAAIQEVHDKLNNITWTGWIARSGVDYATEVLSDSHVTWKR